MPKLLFSFEYSPLATQFNRDNKDHPLYRIELQDTIRAFCGALFFAVPLHFTMEMWERARMMPSWALIIVLFGGYLANVGYNIFSGYKEEDDRKAAWFDALSAMGVGFLASTVTLLLIDQITNQISLEIILKVITLEAIPTSFGASLARNQLGGGDGDDKPQVEDQYSVDKRKILGSLLGALMFSFNIAPTLEPILIARSVVWYQLIGIILFSLVISYAMNFMASFVKNDADSGVIMGNDWAETIIAYVISLLVSAVLLWMFGYLSSDTPLATSLPMIVVLGYVTSLGSAAGRLVL